MGFDGMGDGAYGIHSWKSTELQAPGVRPPPPLLGLSVPVGLGCIPPTPIDTVMVFTRVSRGEKPWGGPMPVGSR